MNDRLKRPAPGWVTWPAFSGLVLVATAAIYALSCGPVIYLWHCEDLPPEWEEGINGFYAPLYRLLENSQIAGGAFNRYVSWWIDLSEL